MSIILKLIAYFYYWLPLVIMYIKFKKSVRVI